jgi:hypothetical protein
MSGELALEARMTRLEDSMNAGFARIESMMRKEIDDLKTEQIKDLRESNTRLADDQRRLWDRVTEFERRENVRIGTNRTLGAIGHFLSAGLGGLVTWIATYLSAGAPPHH